LFWSTQLKEILTSLGKDKIVHLSKKIKKKREDKIVHCKKISRWNHLEIDLCRKCVLTPRDFLFSLKGVPII